MMFSGILKTDRYLSHEARLRLREEFERCISAGKMVVLQPGMEFQPIPPGELLTINEVALMLRTTAEQVDHQVGCCMMPRPVKANGQRLWSYVRLMQWVDAGCPPQPLVCVTCRQSPLDEAFAPTDDGAERFVCFPCVKRLAGHLPERVLSEVLYSNVAIGLDQSIGEDQTSVQVEQPASLPNGQ